MDDTILKDLSLQFEELYSHPDSYLDPPEGLHKELVGSSKNLYDFMKTFESEYVNQNNSLRELLISGFDDEQIWQEIQLQNSPCLSTLKKNIRSFTNKNVSLISTATKEVKQKTEQSNKRKRKKKRKVTNITSNGFEEEEVTDDDDDDDDDDADNEFESKSVVKEKKYKSTVVDDSFFKLRQMEEYLDQQDREEELRRDGQLAENNDHGIDLFDEAIEDDTGVADLKYKDFFDPPTEKLKKGSKNKKQIEDDKEEVDDDDDKEEVDGDDENFDDILEDEVNLVESENNNNKIVHDNDSELDEKELDEDEVQSESKSKFEEKQEMMKKKIQRLEEANISAKPWQLLGESTAKHRPINSLLEEHVSYDHTSVGAPVITEETTETLEEIIKQRIKDEAWDDVQRKQKPTTQPFEYKKAPELNQEKSKISLAEVYEKEYLKQAKDDKEEKENEDHILVKNLMGKLFTKLDALSNFSFTPKPPVPEIKIISNAPSLQMEEVTPITITEASQLAPEEIYDKKKEDVKGATEKTDTERKHERRQKKIKKKYAAKEKEQKEKLKIKSGKITKSSKKKAIDQLKKGPRNVIVNESSAERSVKSSNAFFNKLQDEVKKIITKQKSNSKESEEKKRKKTAEFLKL